AHAPGLLLALAAQPHGRLGEALLAVLGPGEALDVGGGRTHALLLARGRGDPTFMKWTATVFYERRRGPHQPKSRARRARPRQGLRASPPPYARGAGAAGTKPPARPREGPRPPPATVAGRPAAHG